MAKGVVIGGIGGGGGKAIKSIQRGVVTKGSTLGVLDIPINAVDLTKSIVKITFRHLSGTITANTVSPAVKFLNSSTLRLITYATGASISIEYQVIEFENVKSLQSGTSAGSVIDKIVTVNAVDVSKSLLFFSHAIESTNNQLAPGSLRGEINSSTQILFSTSGVGNFQIEWFLVEFN